MKKYILSLITLSTISLSAVEYTGIIEPFETFSIKSQTSGLVEKVDFKNLSYASKNNEILIEHNLEINKLKNLKNKLKSIKEIYKLKEENFNSYNKLKTVSDSNKNDKKIDLLNLKSSIFDIENSIADLEFNISKKKINIENSKIFIKDVKIYSGEVIQQGQVLLDVENHSKSKIVFYVNKQDINKVKEKSFTIKLENKKLNYNSINISSSTDDVYISSYKVEIILEDFIEFGKLVEIEIKE